MADFKKAPTPSEKLLKRSRKRLKEGVEAIKRQTTRVNRKVNPGSKKLLQKTFEIAKREVIFKNKLKADIKRADAKLRKTKAVRKGIAVNKRGTKK